ncbi:signal transducing adapter molecule 2-like protein [Euroglyphus maynei]|uniref:Signal transducing adapter molecule 2-like protein n=1 Tax=Euroglyphus maynei TaxID=6958 RepID=A0A1Y3AYC8_EURMA|nr:signal transducing adapter molecule 2-like protein [Euroglyphus maynei]
MLSILSAIKASPYDPLVEKATSDQNTSEDWQQILEINDRVAVEQDGPKDCMRSIISRLYSDVPWVILQTLTLLDSLVSNCGKRFHLEVCSRDFENELLRLIRGGKNIHPKVSERARLLLKKWAQSKDFKKDPQLNLIPSLYEKLKSEGLSFHSSEPSKRKSSVPDETMAKNPDYVANAEEEAQLAKAIELSIQEAKKRGIKTDTAPVTTTTSSSSSSTSNHHSQPTAAATTTTTSSLYPSFNVSEMNNSTSDTKEPIKVRALYDFEAAEDNELTFKAGEIILVTDSSDTNWWKGSNHRGEGLFPANFVSTDLNAEPEYTPTKSAESKKVQFNEQVKVVKVDKDDIKPEDVMIDEGKIDELMSMLQEADPKAFDDPEELLRLEGK